MIFVKTIIALLLYGAFVMVLFITAEKSEGDSGNLKVKI
jgi:hypothetical protein